ncbi:MAG: hypothetical protein LBF22_03030 [Deltaproteobacteria bacterium]|jgi:hypothetical protein|nr:hypothetical protein [Deltaproteobacteria bacterium]
MLKVELQISAKKSKQVLLNKNVSQKKIHTCKPPTRGYSPGEKDNTPTTPPELPPGLRFAVTRPKKNDMNIQVLINILR